MHQHGVCDAFSGATLCCSLPAPQAHAPRLAGAKSAPLMHAIVEVGTSSEASALEGLKRERVGVACVVRPPLAKFRC